MTSQQILLVEQDLLLRECLSELLTLEGYRTLDESYGQAGLLSAQVYLPDLIIGSRTFPDMDGWAFFQALKEEETTQAIPFIFLSSLPAGKIHAKMEEESASIVLIKPFEIAIFLETIQDCLAIG